MEGQKFLKVTSILMIIGGIIGAIAGTIVILGIGALLALADDAQGSGLFYASSIIMIVVSIIQFIAGIKGVGACSAPAKAASCIKWGVIVAVLTVISMIIGLIGGGEFNLINIVLNLLVPGLYIYGAMQLKHAVNKY